MKKRTNKKIIVKGGVKQGKNIYLIYLLNKSLKKQGYKRKQRKEIIKKIFYET